MKKKTTTKPAKVQHTITVLERDKDMLKDIQNEFYGPMASNPDGKRFLSTEEAFNVLLTVATDRRFTSVQSVDEDGELVYDEDGQPVMEVVDLFEVEANKIIAARSATRRERKRESLIEQLRSLGVAITDEMLADITAKAEVESAEEEAAETEA